MHTTIQRRFGANLDIDLTTPAGQIEWEQDQCPWNQAEKTDQHKCAVKNISICPYFRGVEYLDTLLCSYPQQIEAGSRESGFVVQGPFWGKARQCEPVLSALPAWFGLAAANQHYLEAIDQMPTFLAVDGQAVVGFLTIKKHFAETAEIYVTGVLPAYHRRGLGAMMLSAAETFLRDEGVAYLQVKTLSDSHPDPGYAQTRAFYIAMGFVRLEEFKTLWDEANPALLLIKKL